MILLGGRVLAHVRKGPGEYWLTVHEKHVIFQGIVSPEVYPDLIVGYWGHAEIAKGTKLFRFEFRMHAVGLCNGGVSFIADVHSEDLNELDLGELKIADSPHIKVNFQIGEDFGLDEE